MLSFYRGRETTESHFLFSFFLLKRLKRGTPAPLMPWGPLYRQEVHLGGVSMDALGTDEQPADKARQQVQTRNEETKEINGCSLQ